VNGGRAECLNERAEPVTIDRMNSRWFALMFTGGMDNT